MAAFATAPPPLAVGDQPEKPALSVKNKRSAGGNSLDNSRDGFSGGAQRGLARAGAGAELQHSVLK